MSKYQKSGLLDGLTLGKATEYSNQYDANLLQGVPRSLNRDDLNLSAEALPFYGEDVWYGYEVSWLNLKGKPVVAVAEFTVPCNSENLIESKSFKLYLNSFNQSQFSNEKEVSEILTRDLSLIARANVTVGLFPVDECPALTIDKSNALCIDGIDVEITQYDYSPKLLAESSANLSRKSLGDFEESSDPLSIVNESLVSHLLKSNCLITNQPDWASVYIDYKGRQIDHEALLKYLISFREHNEFHEQCVERIYCDIQQYCNVEELTVFARYTRRGGLDINPYRRSKSGHAPKARTIRQ